ncbi:hypothetical protein BDW69DRAFT_178446 [Aspergillus filifer]
MSPESNPILIVGAGIIGLILGQALKQRNIPFTIYERDPHLSSRHQGWAITLHWALSHLPSLLPRDVLNRIEEVQVDQTVAKNDTGNFLYLNLRSGDVHWRIPPNRRWRVNRERLRGALLQGIESHVHWGRKVEGVQLDDDSDGKPRVLYRQTDSEPQGDRPDEVQLSAPFNLIIGAEGPKSRIRQFLCPESYENTPLPVRFTGVSVSLTRDEIAPLRRLDPLLFQGTHPDSGVFFWFSMLDAPDPEQEAKGGQEALYKVQLGISWPVRNEDTDCVPAENAARLENMKRRAEGFVPFLYEVIQSIPEGTEVIEVTLADWEGPPASDDLGNGKGWDNHDGRVILIGDAAHAMTMYRGEAANHGILDVYHLISAIEKIESGQDRKSAITEYEDEMQERGRNAVRLSRKACLEAHEWESLGVGSAILAGRKL